MPLRTLFGDNAQAAYENVRDILDFHAHIIAITEDIPFHEALRLTRAEAEEAYLAALSVGSDAHS
jgi:succinyl-CoA synthetase alpha subunit